MTTKYLVVFIILFALITNLLAAEIQLTGVYKGKNLYVQNPFSGNMKSFCTLDVFVNGKKTNANPKSSAYEIDLSFLKLNDPVTVKITHKEGCKPKILNPQVIRTLSDFHFVSTTIDSYNLSWSTKGESAGGKHYVEQYYKEKWIPANNLTGHVLSGISNYKTPLEHHTGLNKYRIKYMSKSHKITFSKEVEYISDVEPITFYPKRVSKSITLSKKVKYEVMDSYGNVIMSGNDLKIDCSNLKSGFHYLNIGNQTEKFLKK